MNDQEKWLKQKINTGWIFMGLGILLTLVGVYFEINFSYILVLTFLGLNPFVYVLQSTVHSHSPPCRNFNLSA